MQACFAAILSKILWLLNRRREHKLNNDLRNKRTNEICFMHRWRSLLASRPTTTTNSAFILNNFLRHFLLFVLKLFSCFHLIRFVIIISRRCCHLHLVTIASPSFRHWPFSFDILDHFFSSLPNAAKFIECTADATLFVCLFQLGSCQNSRTQFNSSCLLVVCTERRCHVCKLWKTQTGSFRVSRQKMNDNVDRMTICLF